MKKYDDLTIEEKYERHNDTIDYLREELDSLRESYEETTNIGHRYETLVIMNYLKNLISIEADIRRDILRSMQEKNK